MRRLLIAALLLLCAASAAAALTAEELETVGVTPPPDAALPAGLRVPAPREPSTLADVLGGEPAVAVFVDYTCSELCGPALAQISAALADQPAARVITIGLDPRDDAAAAEAFVGSIADDDLMARTTVLRPDAETRDAIAEALGYSFLYDAQIDRFAHPAAAFVLDGTGKLVRLLSSIGLTGRDVTLALKEAGGAAPAQSIVQQLILACYGYDPVTGRYTLAIERVLAGLSGITVVAIGLVIGGLLLRERRGRKA